MQIGGVFPCLVFLIAGGVGMLLLWALMSALSGSRQSPPRPPKRGLEPGRCRRGDCNHLNNPKACYCGNCGRSLA